MGLRWACNSELRDFGAVDQGIRRSSLRQADWGRVTVLRFGCLQVHNWNEKLNFFKHEVALHFMIMTVIN